jgi:hypothetical protein
MKIGHKCWAIPEGYIPTYSHTTGPELLSHETICILNASDKQAKIELTIFFSDKEPVGPYHITVEAKRTKHVRFNDLNDPQPIPAGTDFASLIVSDVEIVVQHTRLDSRQAENALMTTMAYGCQ